MLAAMKEHLPAASAHSCPAASVSDSSAVTTTYAAQPPLVTSALATRESRLSSVGSDVGSSSPHSSVIMSTGSRSGANSGGGRDSSWLELEACREHLRQSCPRSAAECRFAHPEPRIMVKDGRVTCCYDFLKDRCHRDRCRYFHPPQHIKERLVSAGKQFGAMMSSLHFVQARSYPNPIPPMNAPPSVPLMAPIIYSHDSRLMSAAPPGFLPNASYNAGSDRVEICPDFVQGVCTSPVCPNVHPEPHVRRNLDSTVTVCRDFLRSGCSRENCRYFHPSVNLLARFEPSANPAMMQQGIMVASPVMTVYPPMVYPGPITSIASPPVPTIMASSGMPIYPTVAVPAVAGSIPVPLVLAPPPGVVPPPPLPPLSQIPLSTITSTVQAVSCPSPTQGVVTPPQSIIMSSTP